MDGVVWACGWAWTWTWTWAWACGGAGRGSAIGRGTAVGGLLGMGVVSTGEEEEAMDERTRGGLAQVNKGLGVA